MRAIKQSKSNVLKPKQDIYVSLEECQCQNCPYKTKVVVLQLELQEMRERYWGRKRKKKEEEEDESPLDKKRGALLGHPGWFRTIPKKIDRWIHVTLTQCPKCHGGNLSRYKEFSDHIQEDIILPQLQSTCFRHYSYWCGDCKAKVEPKVPPEELPNSYIGPTAKSLAVWLKYDIKISDRDLKRLFGTLFHLNVVPSSISGFRKQLARYGFSVYEQIRRALQSSSYIHSDETGWRVGKQNSWLWSLSNKKMALFHVNASRGLKVLQQLLEEPFNGTLIADFLAVYNKYKAKSIQRCLVHLLREMKRMSEIYKDDPVILRYLQALKSWIAKARALAQQYRKGRISKKKLQQDKKKLEIQLQDFQITTVQKQPLLRIKKRLARHKNELLTFLDHPEVDWHNNHAEQMIRPNVLLRKITFGNDSSVGALNHGIFMSIIQTAKLNGRSPPEVLSNILLNRENKQSKLSLLGVEGNGSSKN